MCETAEVLCSINELDGYSFSMSEFQHPEDGPDPLCGGSWVPNNPTWFNFIAWCEELTITVSISNCTTAGNPPFTSTGAQVGIYSDCSSFNEVDCIGNDCGNEDDKVLDISGLIIGNVYHFMIDGCLGSACDVDISVAGMCTEEIEDWTNGITGETAVCAGDTETYEVDDLTGASDYHWFIDGSEIDVTDSETNDITWSTAGTYELCVDASNACLDVDEDPEQICTTVVVAEPDAGLITATPNPLCPGETSDITVSGFDDTANTEEVVIIVDPNGVVTEVLTSSTTTSITYDMCGTFTVYSLNYAAGAAVTIPAVGDPYSGNDCVTLCCDEVNLDVVFEDTEDPVFANPPADLTLICFDGLPPMEMLDVTDNCAADDVVTGMETGTADLCDGGTITREWMFSDDCGNTVMHTQTITIDPTIEPDYVNPPASVVLNCADVIPPPIDLEYTNNGMGACLIEGMVTPTVDGMFDLCGTTITYTWDFTDTCGNNLNHVQTIEIMPAASPSYINPPSDLSLICIDGVPPPIDLDYSNSETGACELSGTITPTVDGMFDECGSTVTYTWSYTDPCGMLLEHIQTISLEPAEEASFINPPPDQTIICDAFNGFMFGDLDYSNNLAAPCEIAGTITPVVTDNTNNCGGEISALYEFTDLCGRTISHTQVITVEPPLEALFLNPPPDMTVSCDAIPSPATDLAYSNGENGVCLIDGDDEPEITEDITPCGGTISNLWEYIDDCGRTAMHEQIITVDPAPAPVFDSPPSDITLTCDEFANFTAVSLTYTNNETGICLIEGTIDPSDDGPLDVCGGDITFTWDFTDECGNNVFHEQVITVDPAAAPEFINVPSDMTLECPDYDGTLPILNYDNEEDGPCAIVGGVSAIESGFVDACGGVITLTWTYTDDCNRTISESQQLTFEPAEDPEFEDLPEDMTLGCDEELDDPDFLFYDNDLSSPCRVQGESEPIITMDENLCIITWTHLIECSGNTITHVQTITKLVPVDFDVDIFQSLACESTEFDLSDFDVFDNNETNPDITYHTELPPDNSNEIDPEIIVPGEETEYYIVGTNDFDCFDVAIVTLTPEPLPNAGDDGFDDVCINNTPLDLYAFLSSGSDFTGEFTQVDGPIELDFASAEEINISDAEPGTYIFEYVVSTASSCPEDISILEIEFLEPVVVDLISIECTNGGTTYTVIISNENFDIDISAGTIDSETIDQIVIIDIPIDQNLTIEVQNDDTKCEDIVSYNAPNCACPTVEAPLSLGNLEVCQGETNPFLSVTVGPDDIVNWYDAPTAGNLINPNSLTYLPPENNPGLYTYYAEAENSQDPSCVSPLRTPVTLEIIATPSIQDTFVNVCDDMETGFVSILPAILESALFNGQPNLNATFYRSELDRLNSTNAITFPFTNEIIGNQLIYVKISNNAGCTTDAVVDLIINTIPTNDFTAFDISCLGSEDGEILLMSQSSALPLTYFMNADTVGSQLTNLSVGTYNFTVIDNLTCENQFTATINEGSELSFDELNIECNDNGTNTDSTDDSYTISFQVNDSNNSADQYELSNSQNGIIEVFTFGETVSIELLANEVMEFLTATHQTLGCSVDQELGELLSCSSDCELSLDIFSYECSDNNTPLDPSDDTYNFQIDISAINGGTNNSYNVFINGVLTYNYSYNMLNTFSLSANNETVTIRIADGQFDNCFLSEVTDVLEPCSNDCLIEADLVSTMCDNAGTENDESDDTFTFSLEVEGTNSSLEFTIPDFGYTGSYTTPFNSTSFTITDGAFDVLITDGQNSDCSTTITINPPLPCSEICETTIVSLMTSDCDDNLTPTDESDDFYFTNIIVTTVSGNTTGVMISDNSGNEFGPFAYDAPINIGPFPADGVDITLSITDQVNGSCFLQEVISQNACSSQCQIEAEIISIECNDNQTSDNNDDDIFDVEILVSEPNLSGGFIIDELGINGNFNETLLLTDFEISDGNFALTITAVNDPDCTIIINVTAPSPCSEPCEISLAGLEILECQNNDTGSISEDDFYYINLNVEGITGNGFEYTLRDNNGESFGPFTYDMVSEVGPFPSDGSNIQLNIIDDVNSNCILSFDITNTPCSECPQTIQLSADILLLTCQDNLSNITYTSSETPASVSWTGPSGFADDTESINVSSPGDYFITALYNDGCTAESAITIDSDGNTPLSNAGPDLAINCEMSSVILDANASTFTSNTTLEWTDENGNVISTTNTFEITEPGIYGLQLFDSVSMCSSDINFVTVNENLNSPAAVIFADPGNILDCFIQSIIVSTVQEENTVYTWEINNQTNFEAIIELDEPANITLIALDTISLCQNSSELVITDLTEFPIVQVDDSFQLDCFGNDACIEVTTPSTTADIEYTWSNANGDILNVNGATFCTTSPGIYFIELTDNNSGCTNKDSFEIFDASFTDIILDPVIEIANGDNYMLNPEINILTSEIQSISWTTEATLSCYDCLNPIILEFSDDDVVEVTIVTTSDCEARANSILKLFEIINVYIPNIFSSDREFNFTIFASDQIELIEELYIYDRWGEMVFFNLNFAPNNPDLGWDGFFNGKPAEQGVYIYYVKYLEGSKTKIVTGDITLVR